ncbi:Hypothetical protein A7982_04679 [Minicystis rosea]|nr:Hypothetical protein A7982_04679 [Minicystis rosea]
MKLLIVAEPFGGRASVDDPWGAGRVFFRGAQPPTGGVEPSTRRWLVIDLPGFVPRRRHGIAAWIRARAGLDENDRSIVELDEEQWRLATLDDFGDPDAEVHTYDEPSEQFGFEDFIAFERAHVRPLVDALDAASRAPAEERGAQLEPLVARAAHLWRVWSQLPDAAKRASNAATFDSARRAIGALPPGPARWEAMLDLARRVHAREPDAYEAHRRVGELLRDLPRQWVDPSVSDETLHHWLDVLAREPELAAVAAGNQFWEVLARRVRFPATMTEGTVDITEAEEVTVEPSFELWSARRVGRIVPGRTALKVAGSPSLYVAGTRALRFRIARAGGRVRRFGVDLTMRIDPKIALDAALLGAERLAALAHLAPDQALAEAALGPLPESHPIHRAAARAAEDPDAARTLADLLIATTVHLDPAVVRRMLHEDARASRYHWRRRGR